MARGGGGGYRLWCAVAAASAWAGAEGRPGWANPGAYPIATTKSVFVSSFWQEVVVERREYDAWTAKHRCGADINEVVVFDFSPATEGLRDAHPATGQILRQYYDYGENLQLKDIQIEGADPSLRIVSVVEAFSENAGNKTYDVRVAFFPAQKAKVTLRMAFRAQNFLRSRAEFNVVEWRPFGPAWEGLGGAFVSNISVSVFLPWGTSARGRQDNPAAVPSGKGFNIISSLRDPPPVEEWQREVVAVRFVYDLWASEWERTSTAFFGRGYEPLRIDLLFDRQQAGCNTYPPWLYLVAVASGCTFVALVLSLCAYLIYELPWRSFLQSDALSDRRRFLLHLREARNERKLLRSDGVVL